MLGSVGGLWLLLTLGGVVYWLLLVASTARTLTHPPRQTYASAVSRAQPGDPSELETPRQYEAWTLHSQGRNLAVWDIAGSAQNGPVAIVTHGWASGKVNALRRVPLLTTLCSRVVLWDMPGHGESGGRCTLGALETNDLLALIERVDDGRPMMLCGSSMGSGVTIAAAARAGNIAQVIVEAPYRLAPTPARNVMRFRKAPVELVLGPTLAWIGLAATGRWTGPGLSVGRHEPFDRAVLAGRLECPLLVLHGDADPTCPIEDGRAIARACQHGRFVEIPGGTHQNLWKEPSCRATMEREYTNVILAATKPGPVATTRGRARLDHA